jgi:hypothetical protein
MPKSRREWRPSRYSSGGRFRIISPD